MATGCHGSPVVSTAAASAAAATRIAAPRLPRWRGASRKMTGPGRASAARGRRAVCGRARRAPLRASSPAASRSGASFAASASTSSRSPLTSTISAPKRSACLSAWKPSMRTRSVGGGSGTVAGARLVARLAAAVPEHVVDGGRGRGPVGLDQQFDRVQRAGADLDLLGRVVLDQLLALDPRAPGRRRSAGRRRCAARAGRGCRRTASGGRGRSASASPESARSAAAIWARLKNGIRSSPYGRDVVPGVPARELRWPAPRRCRSARSPGTSRPRLAELAQVALEVAHQLVLGVLAERRARSLRRVIVLQLVAPSTARGAAGPPRPCGSRTARAACAASGTSRSRS